MLENFIEKVITTIGDGLFAVLLYMFGLLVLGYIFYFFYLVTNYFINGVW